MQMKIVINDLRKGAVVNRSWKERLFTRPWQPFITIKWDANAGPPVLEDGQVYRDRISNILYMNSKTKYEMEKADQRDRHKETFRRSNLCGF